MRLDEVAYVAGISSSQNLRQALCKAVNGVEIAAAVSSSKHSDTANKLVSCLNDVIAKVTPLTMTAKALTAFGVTVGGNLIAGTINEAAKTVAITVPNGTTVTALVATFTHTGVSAKIGATVQVSGTTANNFTSAVTYIITDALTDTQNYVVTVTVAA